MAGSAAGASTIAAPRIRLTLLGGFTLTRDGVPLRPGGTGRRVVALLGLLGPMSRSTAAGTLWQDVPEHHALGSLRTAVWRLHRLAPDLVTAEDDHVQLDAGVDVDVDAFTAWGMRMLRAEPAPVDLPAPPAAELLPGWPDEWTIHEREQLRQLRLHAYESLAEALCHRRRFAEAAEVARVAIGLEPLRESAHRTLIRVHLARQDTVAAREQFATFRRLLTAELGIEPSSQLAALLGRHPA